MPQVDVRPLKLVTSFLLVDSVCMSADSKSPLCRVKFLTVTVKIGMLVEGNGHVYRGDFQDGAKSGKGECNYST